MFGRQQNTDFLGELEHQVLQAWNDNQSAHLGLLDLQNEDTLSSQCYGLYGKTIRQIWVQIHNQRACFLKNWESPLFQHIEVLHANYPWTRSQLKDKLIQSHQVMADFFIQGIRNTLQIPGKQEGIVTAFYQCMSQEIKYRTMIQFGWKSEFLPTAAATPMRKAL